MSLSSCSLVLLMANIAVKIACTSFECFIFTSPDPSDPAAEALYHDAAEFAAPVVIFIPDIGKSGMFVALAIYECFPFFGICCHDEERMALAEVGKFVRDGIYEAVVLLLDRLHLFVEFGFLISPIAAEAFKEADHAVLPKAFYVRRVNIHLFQEAVTEKSKEYVRIKEKTVSDTIYFHADLVASIESILRLFENAYFDGALKDRNAAGDFLIVDEIVKVMLEVDCFNLRAFLYSCQKTMEMFSKVQEKCEIEYFRFVLCSNTAFALKLSKNSNLVWTDNIKSPNELGSYHFPLYKCCYDYIKRQYFDCEQFIHDAVAYKKQKSFEVKQKDLSYALEMLYNFYYKTEKEVSESIRKIYEYLKTEENYIPFEEYGRLANYLIAVRKCVDDESLIDGCKDEILKKLRSKVLSNDIIHDLTYHNGIELWTREQQDEYNAFKQEMVNGIKAETSVVLEQVSTPEDIKKLTTSIQVNIERYVGKGNFAGQLDIVGILKVLPECDSEIISELRGAIMELYRSINIVDFLAADKPALISFKEGIKQLIADDEIKDKIKVLQLEWFIGNLDEIILKLDRQNY